MLKMVKNLMDRNPRAKHQRDAEANVREQAFVIYGMYFRSSCNFI